jgi:hypothetical protein
MKSAVKKRKLTSTTNSQEMKLSEKIEAELKSKLNATNVSIIKLTYSMNSI